MQETGRYTQALRQLQILTPLGQDALLLQGFAGQEGVSQLFEFELRMMSENRHLKLEDLVGKKATIKWLLPDGEERLLNGLISSFAQGGSSMQENGEKPTFFTHYRATFVPWLWLLTRTSDCRIFQSLTVPEIFEKILREYGFTEYRLKLRGHFAPREYCVQYRETDFNFISRLLEEEGIFYFFEHSADNHLLVLANHSNEFKPCPWQETVSYKSITGEEREDDVITDFTMKREVRPGQYTVRDFNFEKPSLDLTANLHGKGDPQFEIYDYPGEYQSKDEGERLVGVRIEEEDTPQIVVNGASLCRGLASGYRFELRDHFRRDFNQAYVLTAVHHVADLGESYRSSDGGQETLDYNNTFQCIVHPAPFRPPRRTPVPVVRGTQTAIVVGPQGEEIFTDKYGRIKVQFHWDREGKRNENSSCWIRVSQPWAGKGFGGMTIPRIGQEVIVDFLEGDPDRPIIVGRVYNAESMPPYDLPANMAHSGLMSRSTPGGSPSNFNGIRMNDGTGAEEMHIQAEKDMDVLVKNNRTETVGNDSIERIGNNSSIEVGVNATEKVGTAKVIDVGTTLLIKAGTSITLQCGASTIHMNQAGIISIAGTIVSMTGAINANVASPLTNIAGSILLTNTGAINLSSGVLTRVEGTALGHYGGGKTEVIAEGECLVQGAEVKIN